MMDALPRILGTLFSLIANAFSDDGPFSIFSSHVSYWEKLSFTSFVLLLTRIGSFCSDPLLHFFTLFLFLILRLYFYSQKNQFFLSLCEGYIDQSKQTLHFDEENIDHLITLAHLCEKGATLLQGREQSIYSLPFGSHGIKKISAWLHGRDFFLLQELFLEAAIALHISVIKKKPTRLEAHAHLANAYVLLSNVYASPSDEGEEEFLSWKTRKLREEFHQKFRITAQKAIEELHILNDFAPNDPWVHRQLAYSYRDLQMPLEEIGEYETLYHLQPEDKDALYHLGILYFQQGFNAKGLQVYEELRKTHYKKAKHLIAHYGERGGKE